MKKGFTLVELLVVISIIGILSGIFLNRIGDFRDRAEDARRIADIRHVQTVLELYYNKCRDYPNPSAPTDGTCSGTVSSDPVPWSTLETILVRANISVKSLPKDPDDPRKSYEFGSNGDGYVIKATLNKNDNPVTKEGPEGQNVSTYNIDCGTRVDGTKNQYCVEF